MSTPTDSGPPSETPPIGRRFLHGTALLAAGSWFSYALNFVLNLALARILGPEAFGFYAFVFAVNEFLEIIAAFSLPLAVLQAKEQSDSLLDTAYAVTAGLAGFAFLVALGIAPVLAMHRGMDAAWFIIAFGVFRVLLMLGNLQIAMLERQVRYGWVAGIGVAISNVPSLTAVACAWLGVGVWSLMIRDGLVAFLTFTLTFFVSGYRFRGKVQREKFSQLFSFSGPMFFARAVEIALVRVDRLVVGSFMGNRVLGLYHQAVFLSETGLLVLRPVHRLAFNLFARLQGDARRMARSYDLINYLVLRLVLAGALVLLIFPDETILLLLGEAWLEAGAILRWLAVYAALYPFSENLKCALLARGRVRAHAKIRFLQLCVLAPGITVAAWWGSIEAVAAVLSATWMLGTAISYYVNGDIGGEGLRKLAAVPVLCAAATIAAFYAAEQASWLAELPVRLLPFLPPLLFAALLLSLEPRRLLREVQYLRGQL